MVKDKVYIGSYNNLGFQGIIPAHLRELFTPNGIILTPEQNWITYLTGNPLPQQI